MEVHARALRCWTHARLEALHRTGRGEAVADGTSRPRGKPEDLRHGPRNSTHFSTALDEVPIPARGRPRGTWRRARRPDRIAAPFSHRRYGNRLPLRRRARPRGPLGRAARGP